jgi:hypothetical protein
MAFSQFESVDLSMPVSGRERRLAYISTHLSPLKLRYRCGLDHTEPFGISLTKPTLPTDL